jgi:hypothetical protein
MNLKLQINLRARRITSAFLVFLFAYLMQRSICLIGLDLHHDLLMFDAARQLLHGAIPYKDFFYQYNPATVFLHSITLSLLGEYISSLKVATAFAYALIALSIYLVSDLLGSSKNGLFFAVVWTLLSPFYMPAMNGYHPWATVYMMASVMLALYFLLLGIRNKRLIFYFISGALFSLAFWFKQVAAIQILLVISWFAYGFVKSSDKKVSIKTSISFALGGVIVAAFFMLYLIHANAMFDWYRSAFEFNKIFAITSSAVSSFFFFIKNLLPITKGLGYVSFIWALIPIYIVATLLSNTGEILEGNDFIRNAKILILLLALAGWVQYFPLAHEFHTQLFMAPIFCYLAINFFGGNYNSNNFTKYLRLFLVIIFIFEALVHVYGFYRKNTQLLDVVISESPARGLLLRNADSEKFNKFYEGILIASETGLLPMSGDPLRALVPYNKSQYFSKMGVNWSWPNEVVESGFGGRLVEELKTRNSHVYGDNLIVIPGYHVINLLEMESPLTWVHTLYAPSKSTSSITTIYSDTIQLVRITEDLSFYSFAQNSSVDILNQFAPQAQASKSLFSIYPVIQNIETKSINEVNISFVDDTDIPKVLNDIEYKLYVEKVSRIGFYPNISSYYSKRGDGFWYLSDKLTKNQKAETGQFFLMTGKLFRRQHLPNFSSSLLKDLLKQPIGITKKRSSYEISWSKFTPTNNQLLEVNSSYIAVPLSTSLSKSGTIFIQVTMKDSSSIEWFVRLH